MQGKTRTELERELMEIDARLLEAIQAGDIQELMNLRHRKEILPILIGTAPVEMIQSALPEVADLAPAVRPSRRRAFAGMITA